jgi:hypothetical protein
MCAAAVALIGMSGVASANIYDESIDGDLADVDSGGTPFALTVGTNSVIGEITENPLGGVEEDFVTFEVGAGQTLTSVILRDVDFRNGNTSTGFRLYADIGFGLEQVAPGSFTLGNIGDDYLTIWDLSDVGGGPGLGEGSYGIVVAEFTPGQSYAFDLELIPTPGTVAALGLGGLVAVRRRR